jgi:uncharacterized protein YciI
MPFLIDTYDKPDSQDLRRELSDAHMDFLDSHKHLLLACGAKRSDDGKRAFGGIYLVDVETRAEAAAFIAGDPFSAADLFERVVILRWSKVYLGGKYVYRR